MSKLKLKTALVQKCIETLEENAKIAKEAMDESQASANEYGIPRDRYDSFRAQVLKKRDLYAQQYQICQDNLLIYQKIDLNLIYTNVAFGAIVYTTQHKLLIATSMGKINFSGDDYFVISTQTPLFQAMKGLMQGSTFEFNQGKTKILEVF